MLGPLLFLMFLVMPIAELFVLVQVAQEMGVLSSLALLLAVSILGAWLVKREGLGILARIQQELTEGRIPTTQVVDGFLILLAGALLLTPGFITDAMGVLLLLPPTRALLRTLLIRRFTARLEFYKAGTGFFTSDGLGGRVVSWGYYGQGDVPRNSLGTGRD